MGCWLVILILSAPFTCSQMYSLFLFLINTFVWKSIEYDVFSPFIAVYMCTKYLNITMEVLFKTSFMLFSFATSISAPSCALPGLYQPLDASLQDSEGISWIFFMNLQDWQSGRLTGMPCVCLQKASKTKSPATKGANESKYCN